MAYSKHIIGSAFSKDDEVFLRYALLRWTLKLGTKEQSSYCLEAAQRHDPFKITDYVLVNAKHPNTAMHSQTLLVITEPTVINWAWMIIT